MGSNPRELSLDFKPAYVPKTVSSFLRQLSMIGDGSERLSKLDHYVQQLEDEMRKIDVFKRELPLCMILIEEAIMALKEGEMKCSPSGVRPVMEEFIPLKKKSDEDGAVVKIEKDNRDKKTWMSSVQLWSCDGYSRSDVTCDAKHKSTDGMEERTSECDRYETEKPFHPNNGGAFMPFKGFSGITAMARKEAKEIVPMNGLSLLTPGGDKTPKREMGSDCSISKGNGSSRTVPSSTSNNRSNIQSTQQQTSRKQRRCWSPELHRRFITALQQLGGSLVATPKQIRELMQVDGLTNDEVKSHLQKYRLHTRRISASTSPAANQPVVVLGELWAAQDHYGDSSKTSSALSGSPQGPLQLVGSAGGISAAGDSMEDEDEKSESYSWKGHLQKPSEDNV